MNTNKKLTAIMVAAALGGCATTKVDERKTEINEAMEEAKLKRSISDTLTREDVKVTITDENFLISESIKLSDNYDLPAIFQQGITVSTYDAMTIQELFSVIQHEAKIKINVRENAVKYLASATQSSSSAAATDTATDEASAIASNGTTTAVSPVFKEDNILDELKFMGIDYPLTSQMTSLSIEDTVANVLDLTTARLGLYWEYKNNEVSIYKTKQRTFQFDGSLEGLEYTSSMSTGNDETSMESVQKLETTRSITDGFSEIESWLNAFKNEFGVYSINRTTGSVVIRDTPSVLDEFSLFIKEQNTKVNQKIQLKVEVYDVVISDDVEYGVDWNLVFSGSTKLKFGFDSGKNDVLGGSGVIDIGLIDPDSNWNNSSAVLNALNQVGDASRKISISNMTRNNIATPLQVGITQEYLSKLNKVPTEDGTEITTEIGKANTGLQMVATPRVLSTGEINLDIALKLNELINLKEFSFGETDKIQLATNDGKSFDQDVNVKSGESLVLTGFTRTETDASTDSIFGEGLWMFGGKKGGSTKNIETIILVTPYLQSN
ncbi:hypothetical protein AB6D11_02775 [Vibrio splendidus]